jgi:mono/diheme cytochrome c family protein
MRFLGSHGWNHTPLEPCPLSPLVPALRQTEPGLRVRSFLSTALTVVLAAVSSPIHAQPADAGAPNACRGVLASPQRMRAALAEVPSYSTTFLLVTREGPEAATSLDSPALQSLEMGVHAGTVAEALVAAARLPKVRPYSVPGADAGAMVSDVLSAKIGAAVLWAPLAGLSALERDPENRLAFRTVGGPQPPPSLSEVSKGAETKCAEEIKSLLEAYGVVPAENTVQIAIRPLLHQRVPAADPVAAEAGRAIFAARCARCHGEQVVAARDALAPVDLMRSVRRFTYPAFLYIVLNGRSQKGHPGFRGTLDEQQITNVYQYVRARSRGDLDVTASATSPR